MFTPRHCVAFVLVFFAAQANAATPTPLFSCADLRMAAQKLQVHAQNIANYDTTRTPQGGAYKRIELRCRERYCESIARDDFRLVYNPSHPDANPAGYVQFPRVEIASEFAALNSAAAEVKLLAGTGVCGASALTSGPSAMVKYDAGTSILSDVMNFAADGRLTSWSRTTRDGKSEHYAFSADGTIARGPDPAQKTPSTSALGAMSASPNAAAPVTPNSIK